MRRSGSTGPSDRKPSNMQKPWRCCSVGGPARGVRRGSSSRATSQATPLPLTPCVGGACCPREGCPPPCASASGSHVLAPLSQDSVPGGAPGPAAAPPGEPFVPLRAASVSEVNSPHHFLLLCVRAAAHDKVLASGDGAGNTLIAVTTATQQPRERAQAWFTTPWDVAHTLSAPRMSSEKIASLEFSHEGVKVNEI